MMPAASRGLCAAAAAALAAAACLESPPGPEPGPDASEAPRVWVDRTGESPPPALYGPKLAYDSVNGQILSYGGSSSVDNSGATAILMAWDGIEWRTLCDPCAPGARVFHGFTFDSARGVAVLYGGIDEVGLRHDDLWEWDGAWTQATPDGAPPGQLSHFWMTYDPGRARVVLFGGDQGAGGTNGIAEYDGETWVAIPPVVSAPLPRSDVGANAAYDPISQRVLIFGSDAEDDDLWAWDGDAWTQLCEICTDVRRSSAMLAVDPARERIVIVGGYDPEVSVAGTWELRPDGTPACVSPEPSQRDTGSMAYDATRDVLVQYGGNGTGCGGNCDRTLEMTFGEVGECLPR